MAERVSRRRLLTLGGLAAAGVAVGGCADDDPDLGAPATSTPGGSSPASEPVDSGTAMDPITAGPELVELTAADFAGLAGCVLTPEQAAGPFPTIDPLDRRDITDGAPGHPLQVGLQVVDEACAPVPGAMVECWHADATGDYSQYLDGGSGKDEGEGTTFCRGFQTAGVDGVVEFRTIYPGWYPGRTVHLHISVAIDGQPLLTTQLYFDDEYSRQVFATAPYEGPQQTSNDADILAGGWESNGTLLDVAPAASDGVPATRALAVLGVPA